MSPSIASVANASPASTATQSSAAGTTGASTTIDKNMFLQLLVAQLKNQDPSNPTDGTQFITQLAQFQQLEQSVNSGQDITAIRQDLDQLLANSGSTAASSQS